MTAIRTAARWASALHPAVIVLAPYLLAAAVALTVAPGATLGIAAKAWNWLGAVAGAVIGTAS